MIEIKDLSFGYDKRFLLENLNLSLAPGHIYGLLGKNGAGKSTLIKNITGLAFPQKGSCKINGNESALRSPDVLADLFLIPEELYLPAVSVRKFAKNTSGFYPKFDEDQFFGYLKEFEIESDVDISSLSFGQQKKTMIAFALATNTPLLVMDEPTNGLDIPSKAQFRRIVSTALTENRCIVISTHQVRDLDNMIDGLIVLDNRHIVLNASVEAISEKLFFTSADSTEDKSIIYSESSIRGITAIVPNADGRTSKVDLELLFNALIDGGRKIHEFI